MQYAGAEWLKANRVKDISPFGERVADLVGYLWEGIYHIHNIERRDWSHPYAVEIVISSWLSTVDNRLLTQLVLLAHRMAIRISIEPCSPKLMRLRFDARDRQGDFFHRHPTIEEALETFKADCYLPTFEEVKHGEEETSASQ